MNEQIALLPCPFCGSVELNGPHISEYIGDHYSPSWWVACENCPGSMEVQGEDVDGLIEAWNRRDEKVNMEKLCKSDSSLTPVQAESIEKASQGPAAKVNTRQLFSRNMVRTAMEDAVKKFGGNDNIFNSAGFGSSLMRLANLRGGLDGNLVEAILSGRNDVQQLQGGAHYRLLKED